MDWERGRIVVRSPKTEHHEGKGERIMPLFPELRPYLEAVYDEAPEGTEYVITRYRHRNANLRTQLCKIIRRAGLVPWPKLFQNLRSTRETELAERFPIHVVCEWIGNSKAVAAKHYLQTTDAHFEAACVETTGNLHNPVQSAAGKARNESHPKNEPLAIAVDYEGLREDTFVQAPRTQPIYELWRESAKLQVAESQRITEFESCSVGGGANATVCELRRAPDNRYELARDKTESAARAPSSRILRSMSKNQSMVLDIRFRRCTKRLPHPASTVLPGVYRDGPPFSAPALHPRPLQPE